MNIGYIVDHVENADSISLALAISDSKDLLAAAWYFYIYFSQTKLY